VKALAVAMLVLLAGCSSMSDEPGTPSPQVAPSPSGVGSGSVSPGEPSGPATSSAPASPTVSVSPSETGSRPDDPRWRFFGNDRRPHLSPWYPGRARVMIPFGCTPAPYYSPDPSCPDGRGFHHGIDVALPCGTPLRSGRAATVLDHGALGPAYGVNPVLLRVGGFDVVIGHTRKVFVGPGDRVRRGAVFARVSDSGAPDGCHLHFEVRRPGGGVSAAVDPATLLALRP
jgi:murein DD-endopeptidase MepM/ murein hydrolase activator NlpD